MLLQSAAFTDRGLLKPSNQDSFLVSEELALFAVADGMGGYKGGEIASSLAIEMLAAYVGDARDELASAPDRVIEEAFHAANFAIFNQSLLQPDLIGMGTTLTCAAFSGTTLAIAHVGDSRCYLLNEKEIVQLTVDHATLSSPARSGPLADRGKLARAVGVEETLSVDVFTRDATPGEVLLLCTDGLTAHLSNAEIHRLFHTSSNDLQPLARMSRSLLSSAKARGASDNVSAVIVRVEPRIDP